MSENGHKRLSADDLLAVKSITTEEVSIPQLGGMVLVRGLTRAELHAVTRKGTLQRDIPGLGKKGDRDTVTAERYEILYGLVEPKLTADQIINLMEQSAGAVGLIVDAIERLSGLGNKNEVAAAEETFQGES